MYRRVTVITWPLLINCSNTFYPKRKHYSRSAAIQKLNGNGNWNTPSTLNAVFIHGALSRVHCDAISSLLSTLLPLRPSAPFPLFSFRNSYRPDNGGVSQVTHRGWWLPFVLFSSFPLLPQCKTRTTTKRKNSRLLRDIRRVMNVNGILLHSDTVIGKMNVDWTLVTMFWT